MQQDNAAAWLCFKCLLLSDHICGQGQTSVQYTGFHFNRFWKLEKFISFPEGSSNSSNSSNRRIEREIERERERERKKERERERERGKQKHKAMSDSTG
jgi:Na+-translocating ferredoxin:NAD+ oxidoreductase RnfC subunit